MTNRFTVTGEHLRLLSNMEVGWQNDEFGAPEIDPKRPYGNSSVFEDMLAILGLDDTEENRDKARRLHEETEVVLQIGLQTGEFAAGTYEREQLYPHHWRMISADLS